MAIEERLFREINALAGQFRLIDLAMITISSPLTWVVVGCVILLCAFFLNHKKLLTVFFAALVSLGLADLVSFRVVKQLVARERPCRMMENINLILDQCGGSYGFTSNHSANAFAVWASVALGFGARSPTSALVIALASLVAISRVYLGVHFVGDIVGGAILGMIIGLLVERLGITKYCAQLAQKLSDYRASSGK
jgi:undecaprenyl-diphosphatase